MKLKKISAILSAAVLVTMPLVGCGGGESTDGTNMLGNTDSAYNIPQDHCRTYYEIFVRSFADGNGDGIGDLRGLIDNLDYLNDGDDTTDTDLGINGIWLMPIQNSPSYHGYDVIDYMSVNPRYGTIGDFDELVSACNDRGIWLQIDLVLNHSSSQHAWFKSAERAAKRGYDPETDPDMARYNIVRADSRPGEKWYQISGTTDYWYLGNFDSAMPDLNLDNADVRAHITETVDFWVEDHGVRSFRLDAVPYAYGDSGNSLDNENIEFWTWFNDYCNEKGAQVYGKEGDGIERYCYNVGEVWGSATAIEKFYETGMTNFNFTYSGSYATAVNGTSQRGGAGLVSNIAAHQTVIDNTSSYALMSNFLSNHDSDRSAGSMRYDPVRIKKAAGLYLLMPGNPYIYYGEEIGAAGSGSDPNRRLPFNWGDGEHGEIQQPDGANFKGQQVLGSVKDQTDDKDSVLSYYRQAIKLRNRFPEIGRGTMTPYAVSASGKLQLMSQVNADSGLDQNSNLSEVNALNKTVAAYSLKWGEEEVIIVDNIGDKSVSIDASVLDGYKIVGMLKANGGNVSFMSGSKKLNLSAGTVAVLKKTAESVRVKG